MPITTIKIDPNDKTELNKIAGELQTQDGKVRTYEDTIHYLIEFYKQRK